MKSVLSRFLIGIGILLLVVGPALFASSLLREHVEAGFTESSDAAEARDTYVDTGTQSVNRTRSVPDLRPTKPLPVEPLEPITAVTDVGAPQQLHFSRIGINTRIVAAKVVDGTYVVPSFAAGHHIDSPLPGNPGNAVINGHLESINAGQVFQRLSAAETGDQIIVTSANVVSTWEVTSVRRFDRSDSSWLFGGSEPTLTLYTCAGSFDWRAFDYTERLVVTARRLEMIDR